MSEVVVSLDAYSLDLTGANIAWYVDDIENPTAHNERSMTLETGELGSKAEVRAVITKQGGMQFTISKTIKPVAVDLITEASTFVPIFYKGRALPVEDMPVRFIVIPHTGSKESPETFTYEWKLDGTVLFGGPIQGRFAADLVVPRYSDHILSVTVFNPLGEVIGMPIQKINPATPELYFYEESLLRGLSDRAITDSYTLVGDEVTIYGQPYYIGKDIGSDSTNFTWNINGTVTESTGEPYALTLRRTGGNGQANVGLEVLTKTHIPKFVEKTFSIFF